MRRAIGAMDFRHGHRELRNEKPKKTAWRLRMDGRAGEWTTRNEEGAVKSGVWSLLGLACLFMMLLSCSDVDPGEGVERETPPPVAPTHARFDIATGNPADIPIPNDMLLRNPATGRVAIPFSGEPYDSINSLYGFSVSAPVVIPFDGPIDRETVDSSTIMVVDLATFQPAAMSLTVVDNPETGASTVFAVPIVPLAAGHPHIGIVTQGVRGLPSNQPVESVTLAILLKGEIPFVDAEGRTTVASFDDATAARLEPLRVAYQTVWSIAEQVTGLDRSAIPIAFPFTTQPLHQTVPAMRERLQSENPTPTITMQFTTPQAVDALYTQLGMDVVPHGAVGRVYKGTFNAPNFVGAYVEELETYVPNPLQGFFQGSGADVLEINRQDLNFWAILPAGAQGPVPVMIFQHGFLSVKEVMFVVANAACANGVGVIGIDAALHGERVGDFFDNETGQLGPDGLPDRSGTGAVNPGYPRTMRDNFRQTILDLCMLTRMISSGQTDFDGDMAPEFAPSAIVYAGQSMGGIIGGMFCPVEPNISLGVLNVPGGRYFTLFPNSAEVSPIINAGLAQAGILPGTAEYTLFFLILQTVMDDADPFTYGVHMNSGGLAGGAATHVLIQEMIGDTVVPNANTEDLARAIGLPQVAALQPIAGLPQVDAPFVGPGIYQFQNGAHGFLATGEAATEPGQIQLFTFLLTGLTGTPTIIDPYAQDKTHLETVLSVPLSLETTPWELGVFMP